MMIVSFILCAIGAFGVVISVAMNSLIAFTVFGSVLLISLLCISFRTEWFGEEYGPPIPVPCGHESQRRWVEKGWPCPACEVQYSIERDDRARRRLAHEIVELIKAMR